MLVVQGSCEKDKEMKVNTHTHTYPTPKNKTPRELGDHGDSSALKEDTMGTKD